MAAYDTILSDTKGDICTITLNKPKRKNAINFHTYTELVSAINAANENPAVRALILTGAGDYFTSGADLSESEETHYKEAMRDPVTAPVGQFMLALLRFPKLLIAAVNGPAVGIGVTLLVHCDLCYASTSATFWTPFARVAVVPEFCSSVTFPKIFGPSRAAEMLIGTRLIGVEEARSVGLISQIYPPEVLLDKVRKDVRAILDQPLGDISIPLFKRMLKRPVSEELERVFREEMVELGKRSVKGETATAVKMALQQMKAGAEGARSKL